MPQPTPEQGGNMISENTYRSIDGNMVMLVFKNIPGGDGEVIAAAQYSHPKEHFLWVVLVKYPDKYVTWIYNDQVGGYSNGDYFHLQFAGSMTKAYRSFMERAVQKVGLGGYLTVEEVDRSNAKSVESFT